MLQIVPYKVNWQPPINHLNCCKRNASSVNATTQNIYVPLRRCSNTHCNIFFLFCGNVEQSHSLVCQSLHFPQLEEEETNLGIPESTLPFPPLLYRRAENGREKEQGHYTTVMNKVLHPFPRRCEYLLPGSVYSTRPW